MRYVYEFIRGLNRPALASLSVSLLILSGCELPNSSSRDDQTYGATLLATRDPGNDPALSRFYAAKRVLGQNCVSCHSVMNFTSEADAVATGWIIPQKPDESKLWVAVRGSGRKINGFIYSQSMPPAGPISQSQRKVLLDWINQMDGKMTVGPVLPPEVPLPTQLSTSPESPSRTSTTPLFRGLVSTAVAEIRVFSDSSCSTEVGRGPRATFLSPGIALTLQANRTAQLHLRAIDVSGNSSPCVPALDYTHDSLPPNPPTFVRTEPASPSTTETNPAVFGTAGMDATRVRLYSNASCSAQIGTGNAADFRSQVGVPVAVQPNATTTLYATLEDAVGNVTACTLLGSYRHTGVALSSPTFSGFSPASPSNQTSPRVMGSSVSGTVTLYSNSTCTVQIGTGTHIAFADAGISASVGANTTTNIYARVEESGVRSPCTYLADYLHDSIPPAPPTFTRSTPVSPALDNETNSRTPRIQGTAAATTVEIILYSNSGCSSEIGRGSVASFESAAGIGASITQNEVTTIYARARDSAGNLSSCVLFTSYDHNPSASRRYALATNLLIGSGPGNGRCTECHTTGLRDRSGEAHWQWPGANDPDVRFSVVAGSPSTSRIYRSLGGNEFETPEIPMPPNVPFSDTELKTVRIWIEAMTPVPEPTPAPVPTATSTSGPGGGSGPGSACGTDASPTVIRRLTRMQYNRSVRDVLARAIPSADAIRIANQASASIPEDQSSKEFASFDQGVTDQHIDGYIRGGLYIGQDAGQNFATQLWSTFAESSCAANFWTNANNAACVQGFIRNIGLRILRRPLEGSATETDPVLQARSDMYFYYQSWVNAHNYPDWQGNQDALTLLDRMRYLLGVFFNSPDFLYHLQIRGAPVDGATNTVHLTGFELASRLSYSLWESGPDDALLESARTGAILTDEGFNAEVARVYADTKTRQMVDHFVQEWLKLEEIPQVRNIPSDEVGQTFPSQFLDPTTTSSTASGNAFGIVTSLISYRQAVIDEALDLFRHYVWTSPSGLRPLLTSDRSFARDADLAASYGVAAWNGTAAHDVRFTNGDRSGLATRAWMTFTGKLDTRPIMRGVRIRRDLLCDTLASPESNNPPVPTGTLSSTPTVRERIVDMTQQSGTACILCHLNRINPLGFALENYDSLGRFRTREVRYSNGEWGPFYAGTATVDASSRARVVETDDRTINGGVELSAWLADSGRVEACMARKYFRFQFGRMDTAGDACVVDSMRDSLMGAGGTMGGMFRAISSYPGFKTRVHGEPGEP